MANKLFSSLAALLAACAGGVVFYYLHTPLPWTLGSMGAAAALAIAGSDWRLPGAMRDAARPVVGVLAGSAFLPSVVASISEWWSVILLVTSFAVALSILGWIYFRLICGFDRVTAFFASSPGGLGELTLLGGMLGGNMRTLVLVHAVRVIAVVFAIPFLLRLIVGHDLGRSGPPDAAAATSELSDWLILVACALLGYVLGKVMHFRAGIMIFPLLLSAAVHGLAITEVRPPYWLVAMMQIVIGSIAGSRFAGVTWQEMKGTALQSVLWTCIVLLAVAGFSEIGSYIYGMSFTSFLLALSPAGMAEMTIISYALGIDTAFVVTCQICRILLVLIVAPSVFQLFGKPIGGPPAPPSKKE